MLDLLKSFNTNNFNHQLKKFLENHESLIKQYTQKRNLNKIPINISNQDIYFSTGDHNSLQKAIIEKFAPRFTPNAQCLYLGDTSKKDLIFNEQKLIELGLAINIHNKLPDIILYLENTNQLFFVEAVTSVGAIDPKRLKELNELTQNVVAQKSYITAFPDFKTYKKFC